MSAGAGHFEYVLRLGDSSLILAQRLAEWCGHGPVLEEDIALVNIALDYLGQARLLLAHAGNLENRGRGEDELAYLRDPAEFRNVTLAELPNAEPVSHGTAPRDYAFTVVRNFLFSAWQCQLWPALERSADRELAGIAGKSAKEARYHFRHSSGRIVRLGDGTEESHRRVAHALARLHPYCGELFEDDDIDAQVADTGTGVRASGLEPAWRAAICEVLEEAGLEEPGPSAFRSRGRHGIHSEHLGRMLAEMQFLQRAYPGARW